MRIPADDSLVLPDSDDGELVADPTAPAWDGTSADLLGLLPGVFRSGTQIDRDAVLAMLGDVSNEEWARFAHVLEAQQSPRFADGEWLDWWGDQLGRKRQPGETETAFRARLLSPPAVITPAAIKGAVDSIVATFTDSKAIYLEPAIDAAFCAPLGSTWNAFAQSETKRLLSDYPDAAYTNPPSYTTPITTGGLFWIVLPANSGDHDRAPFASPLSGGFTNDWQFVAPVSPTPSWGYGYSSAATASLGELIISEVERRIAAGTAYAIYFDPLLFTAV